MDFFAAQDRARRRSSRLVLLFILACLGTVLATYLVTVVLLRQTAEYRATQPPTPHARFAAPGPPPLPWWNPALFAGVTTATLALVGIASLYKWRQYAAGGAAVAEQLGARPVDPQSADLHERRLLNVVEEMSIAAGVPVPAVYVLDQEPAINAFAAGLTTSDAVVAVTRGTMEKLTRDELQGVVAHEFSHILNGDMRLNMRLTALVFGILVLGLVGRTILHGLGRPRTRQGGKGGIAVVLAAGLALIVIGYIGYFFGRVIQAAVSRQREYLADASSVQFTRNPGGILGALKKIGGYALGSSLVSSARTEIGHFLFAQGFRSGITGLWSTHPPLPDRIRAIDPQFDGQMFEPPQLVDITRESFRTAGFRPPQAVSAEDAAHRAFAAPASVPMMPPPEKIPFNPAAAVATIGTLRPGQIVHAQQLLGSLPERLHQAAHHPDEARVIVLALLLDEDAAVRARQRNLISTRLGLPTLPRLDELEPLIRRLPADQRLPLLQLSLPAFQGLTGDSLAVYLNTLDELVHADAQVSTFEFALQKIVAHTLGLRANPSAAVNQYHSFAAVAGEIGTVLSALARASAPDLAGAGRAFAAGPAQLGLIREVLEFTPAADLAALDRALDKLALASSPIKQRTLIAAANVVNADGCIAIEEFELLRAIAAALDCPMPPLGTEAAAVA